MESSTSIVQTRKQHLTKPNSSHFDQSLSGQALKDTIAEIAGLKTTLGWEVMNQEGSLCIIHFTETGTDVDYSIQGWVIDLKNKRILSRGVNEVSAYPTSLIESIPVSPKFPQGGIRTIGYEDEEGVIPIDEHSFSEHDSIKLSERMEGTIIVVFRHEGKTYSCTRKRFDLFKVSWGKSNVGEIWQERGGDQIVADLYDPSITDSPFIYTFVLCDPRLFVFSKRPLNQCGIFLLGVETGWVDPPFAGRCLTNGWGDVEEYELYGSEHYIEINPKVPEWVHRLTKKELSVEEANLRLQFGYSSKEALSNVPSTLLYPGDDVILKIKTKSGETRTIMLESMSAMWRRRNFDQCLPNFFAEFMNSVSAVLGGRAASLG